MTSPEQQFPEFIDDDEPTLILPGNERTTDTEPDGLPLVTAPRTRTAADASSTQIVRRARRRADLRWVVLGFVVALNALATIYLWYRLDAHEERAGGQHGRERSSVPARSSPGRASGD